MIGKTSSIFQLKKKQKKIAEGEEMEVFKKWKNELLYLSSSRIEINREQMRLIAFRCIQMVSIASNTLGIVKKHQSGQCLRKISTSVANFLDSSRN
jgi:hypothetical protein